MFQDQEININKELWLKILQDQQLMNEKVFAVFNFLLKQDRNEASGKEIALALGYKNHGELNLLIPNFSKRIIKKHPEIKIPERDDGTKRLWHIPFAGCQEKTKFNWILREELREALLEIKEKTESDTYLPEEIVEPDKIIIEGACRQVIINAYERDRHARKICLEKYGYHCQVCGFDFEKVYGKIGQYKIHVHHKIPVSQYKKEYVLNPETDLIPVCPNCHLMLHSKKECLSIEELREIIKENKVKKPTL